MHKSCLGAVEIDCRTDDIHADVARLEARGATPLTQVKSWWVMQVPTGQRFCVIRPQQENFAERAAIRPAPEPPT